MVRFRNRKPQGPAVVSIGRNFFPLLAPLYIYIYVYTAGRLHYVIYSRSLHSVFLIHVCTARRMCVFLCAYFNGILRYCVSPRLVRITSFRPARGGNGRAAELKPHPTPYAETVAERGTRREKIRRWARTKQIDVANAGGTVLPLFFAISPLRSRPPGTTYTCTRTQPCCVLFSVRAFTAYPATAAVTPENPFTLAPGPS